MEKKIMAFYCNVTLLLIVLLLVGCVNNTSKQSSKDIIGNESNVMIEEETDGSQRTNKEEVNGGINKVESNTTVNSEKQQLENSDNLSEIEPNKSESVNEENKTNNTDDNNSHDLLSKFTSEEIEYARVWLQLGTNQDIDELYVKHVPAGTSLNLDDESNVGYPEDVIQIFGSRNVDGMVTYSGNGDGTINVYNIPRRWYGGLSRPENVSIDDIREQMNDIIKNTQLVPVNPGNDEEISKIIEKMNIQ